jgi:hypothetical protein
MNKDEQIIELLCALERWIPKELQMQYASDWHKDWCLIHKMKHIVGGKNA